jgi:DNA (cytosine-5)-methyltransferase 1
MLETENIQNKTNNSTALTLLASSNMAVPSDVRFIKPFLNLQRMVVDMGRAILQRPDLTPETYKKVFSETQKSAEKILLAELKMGEYLKSLPTAQGKRTDLKDELSSTEAYKSKKEAIEAMGISAHVAFDMQNLTPEAVNSAIEKARDKHLLVNRKMAKEFITDKKRENNTKLTDFEGIYDNSNIPTIEELSKKERLYYTQLFASCGVGEEHLEKIGLYPSIANELEADRCKWYSERHSSCKVIPGDFTNDDVFNELVKLHLEKKNTIILASPVCRDFSTAGARNVNSPRAKLFLKVLEFIKAVDKTNQYVAIENVPQFLTAAPESLKDILGDLNIGEYIKKFLEDLGYTVNISVMIGCDYNTAQNRKRAIITASKNGIWKFPKKDDHRLMLWQVIGHLPSIEAGQKSSIKWHYAPALTAAEQDFLAHTPTGHSALDNPAKYRPVRTNGQKSGAEFKASFCRNSWSKPAATVMQHNDNIGSYTTIHPGRPKSDGTWSDARVFSILELILITGLDESYFIPEWAKDSLIRNVLGDCLLPNVNLALCSMIPGRKET